MSNRWPGGVIRKTPVTPAGPIQNGAASGVWSLADAAYWTKQGLWPTAGNFLAVEDVFSTWLYTGNGASQTITNGIDLAGKGGLIWLKNRSSTAGNVIASHALYDTVRGIGAIDYVLRTDTTAAQNGIAAISSVNSDGFTFGGGNQASGGNNSGDTYASWTFREAPNFFDVVTWTGNGANRNIAHNLGSVPGMIIVKRTDTAADWQVYHRSTGNTQYTVLNSTAAAATGATRWNNTTPTATEFTVGTDATVNASGGTYVAYLYAHDTSSTGLIQCGTYTGNGNSSVQNINLGWEPQWILIKQSVVAGGAAGYADAWQIVDNMRGLVVGADDAILNPNNANAENTNTFAMVAEPTATGWQVGSQNNYSGATYIYMAIRRGPMRTPTLGTSVFAPSTASGNITTNFPSDSAIAISRAGGDSFSPYWASRLTGADSLTTSSSGATQANFWPGAWVSNTQFLGGLSANYASYNFRRAPSFFDEVCYTGINATRTVNHSLGVVPELIIVKNRTTGGTSWPVWSTPFSGTNDTMLLNTTAIPSGSGLFTTTPPTSTVFTVANDSWINSSGNNYVAYLFASCPGVSKVGTYTGNGSSQTINCAFTTGARFVLIKRTDSTGGWLVWDSARGIVAGDDPYLALNSTAIEVATNDSVDTDNTGFIVNQVAASNVNVNGATYIFLAIA